jgi:signal transduction histidine kinase
VNAAIGLVACGVSLFCLSCRNRLARALGILCALLAGAIGGATLSEHLMGWNLGIDELLFREAAGSVATASPNRMGPNASTTFMLQSIALLGLYIGKRRTIAIAQSLAAATSILAIVPLIGFVYGAQQLYSVAQVTGIAAHTAGALLVLALGVVSARRDVGPVSSVFSEGAGGILIRRLWFPAVPLPFLLGYLAIAGYRANLYDIGLAAALITVSLAVVLSMMVWRTGVLLDRVDAERSSALKNERVARADAEQALKLKDQFLATLSHELRTPLNAMLGWAQMLRERALGEDENQRAADVIARNGQLLGRLVEDLLDTSRISAGHLVLAIEPVDLSQIVQTEIESVAPSLADRNLRIENTIPEGLILDADPQRLRQIVRNVLSNAVKFSERDGRITTSAVPTSAEIELVIADTGVGIRSEFLPHIFERFRQEDGSTTRRHSGLGLGLSIVKDLTELHGGRVAVASPGPGLGTTVTLTLPRNHKRAGERLVS